MEPLIAALQAGRPARTAIPSGEEEAVRRLQLMTSKQCSMSATWRNRPRPTATRNPPASLPWPPPRGAASVIVSAAIEAEVSTLPEADRAEFLEGARPVR